MQEGFWPLSRRCSLFHDTEFIDSAAISKIAKLSLVQEPRSPAFAGNFVLTNNEEGKRSTT